MSIVISMSELWAHPTVCGWDLPVGLYMLVLRVFKRMRKRQTPSFSLTEL